MSRHTCHIQIIAEKVTLPDPDGNGKISCVHGEIRLVRRADAEEILRIEGEAKLEYPSIRILTEEESAKIDADT